VIVFDWYHKKSKLRDAVLDSKNAEDVKWFSNINKEMRSSSIYKVLAYLFFYLKRILVTQEQKTIIIDKGSPVVTKVKREG
jgi:hypothetical protein